MTIANFKARVYGFINRNSTLFTTTDTASIDHVLYALNDARRLAQRAYSFELLRKDVFLTTSEFGADWTTGCKTTPGGATAILLKRPDSVWNYSANSTPAGTVYARTSRVDFGNSSDFKREVMVDSGIAYTLQTATSIQQYRRKFAYLDGSLMKIVGVDTAAPILINGITFLADLIDADPPDIFLTYFPDWLHWTTLMQLNQFLKDDQRINLDATFVANLWQSVKEMDGQIANAGDGASLD